LAHEQSFCIECKIELLGEPRKGVAPSRKKAEQQAAQSVLDLLN
jgi:dsRNA-specific ribonuclease